VIDLEGGIRIEIQADQAGERRGRRRSSEGAEAKTACQELLMLDVEILKVWPGGRSVLQLNHRD